MTSTKPFIFTPQHEEIIRDALFPYHMLKATQITDLIRPGKPGNLKKIQERLSELREHKYVIADALMTKSGPHPYVYYLGLKGKRYLEDIGHQVDIYYQQSGVEHLTYKKLHTLEVNNFLILAQTLPKFAPQVSFSDLVHELYFEKHPLEYLEADSGKLKTIKPDALFKFHLTRMGQAEKHVNCWVEIDRGTENEDKIKFKLVAIYDYIKRGYLDKYYGQNPVLIFIVTTAGEGRLLQLKKFFRQTFPDINPKSGNNRMFKFGQLPPLTKKPPDPLTVFTQPGWMSAYGEPDQLQAVIEL